MVLPTDVYVKNPIGKMVHTTLLKTSSNIKKTKFDYTFDLQSLTKTKID